MEKSGEYSGEDVTAPVQVGSVKSVGEVEDHEMKRGLRPRHL